MIEVIVFSPYFNPAGRVSSRHRSQQAAIAAWKKCNPGEGWGVALRGPGAQECADEIKVSLGDAVEVWT